MMMSDGFKEIGSEFETLKTLSSQEEPENISSEQGAQVLPGIAWGQEQGTGAIKASLYPGDSNHELSRKLNEMIAKYEQLNNRCKYLAEARDTLSRQVSELRKKVSDYEDLHASGTAEAIRLLSKLIDEESRLRDDALKNGHLPLDHNPYDRHNQFVNIFFKLMVRSEK